MNADELVALWIRKQMRWKNLHGFDIHEQTFGCTVTISNVRAGLGSMGACETCYHEYPAILFDVACSCPPVPGKKDPSKLRRNPNRLAIKDMELSGTWSLSEIVADMLEEASRRR